LWTEAELLSLIEPYRPPAPPVQLILRHQPLLNERGPDPAAQAVWSKLHLNLSLDLDWQHLVKQGRAEALVLRWVNRRPGVLSPFQTQLPSALHVEDDKSVIYTYEVETN
jgi:hypothetical protein